MVDQKFSNRYDKILNLIFQNYASFMNINR